MFGWLSPLRRVPAIAVLLVAIACSAHLPAPILPAANVSAYSSGPSVYEVLYRFRGAQHGDAQGVFGLISDGAGGFYGTSNAGGTGTCPSTISQGCGTVFRLTRSTTGLWKESVVFSFRSGEGGSMPLGHVTLGHSGVLYGTTTIGGSFNQGTVFALVPPSSPHAAYTERVLYSFKGGTDGASPQNGIYIAPDGSLYGVTTRGGNVTALDCKPIGCGTIFKLAPSGTQYVETIVHRFGGGSDGFYPSSGLVRVGNAFYGTNWGGVHHYGRVYSLSGSTVTTLHAFNNLDGATPGAIMADPLGNIYGATNYGGGKNPRSTCIGAGCGTLFELARTKSGFVFSSLFQFDGADGFWPRGTMKYQGALYGTLEGDSYVDYSGGAVYKFDPSGGAQGSLTLIHRFTVFAQGLAPGGETFGPGLTSGPDGRLYGLTVGGGLPDCTFKQKAVGCGVFYSLTP